ncbi:MAG: hypothetical protein M1838_003013 [Thelocarpon superellum]|nr:MAG: hypothetical protein M1838_003013 [Thelocarpon superellum]
MSKDDPYFFTFLASLAHDLQHYSSDVTETVDRHFENVALTLREALSSATWLPESARPAAPLPPSPPSPSLFTAPSLPDSLYQRTQNWIMDNKTLTAAILTGVTVTGYFLLLHRPSHTKRRARRAGNGARKEVVVIVGSPYEPISRSLSLDLERRGFIVYMVVGTPEEENCVMGESRVDIRPLNLEIVDPNSSESAIEQFRRFLLSPHHAFPGAAAHHLHLAGVILIPDMIYPSGPIETIAPDLWSDALNVKVLATIATTQVFLRLICDLKARLLILTPGIVPSLSAPFHGVESSMVAALEAFTNSLRAEVGTMGISVCHFKLGTFDCGGVGGKTHMQPKNAARADVLSWSPTARAAYARNYVAQSATAVGNGGSVAGQGVAKGSPLRALHISVFDALTRPHPRPVWHVGRGSLLYDIVGRWVPTGLVARMLGIRPVPRDESAPDAETVGWETVEHWT